MHTTDKMSFGDFVFFQNPEKIEIIANRKIAKKEIPDGHDAVWDFGYGGRTVKGNGEFFGEDCTEQFKCLHDVMKRGGVHALYIPGVGKINAVFGSLTMLEEDHENAVSYAFVFTEVCGGEAIPDDTGKETFVREGECLWDIAYRTGIEVEKLLEANPNIRRADSRLQEDERIYLK